MVDNTWVDMLCLNDIADNDPQFTYKTDFNESTKKLNYMCYPVYDEAGQLNIVIQVKTDKPQVISN